MRGTTWWRWGAEASPGATRFQRIRLPRGLPGLQWRRNLLGRLGRFLGRLAGGADRDEPVQGVEPERGAERAGQGGQQPAEQVIGQRVLDLVLGAREDTPVVVLRARRQPARPADRQAELPQSLLHVVEL